MNLTQSADKLISKITCQGALLTALNCTICIFVSMVFQWQLIEIAPICSLIIYMIYREHTWKRCLLWWFCCVIHIGVLLLIMHFLINNVPLFILMLSLYFFVVAYLYACGLSVFGTIVIATITPFIFMQALENTTMAMTYAKYWFLQVSMSIFVTFLLSPVKKTNYYHDILLSKLQYGLRAIKISFQSRNVRVLMNNLEFQEQTQFINDFFPHNQERKHLWLTLAFYIRNISMMMRAYHRYFSKIRNDPLLITFKERIDVLCNRLSQSIDHQNIHVLFYDNNEALENQEMGNNISNVMEEFHSEFLEKKILSNHDYINFSTLLIIFNRMYLMLIDLCQYYHRYRSERAAPMLSDIKFTFPVDVNWRAVYYGFKIVIGLLLGLFMCDFLKNRMPNIQTAPIMATILVILMEFNVVRSTVKSIMRVLGSLFGLILAVVGLLLFVKIGHLSWMLVFLFLALLISAYYSSFHFKYPYAGLMIGVMLLIILLGSSSITYDITVLVNRSIAIIFGIFLATLVSLFFWPAYPIRQLKFKIGQSLVQIAELLMRIFRRVDVSEVAHHRGMRLFIERLVFDSKNLYVDSNLFLSIKQQKYYLVLLEEVERSYILLSLMLHVMVQISKSDNLEKFNVLNTSLQPLKNQLEKLADCILKNDSSNLDFENNLNLYRSFSLLIEEKTFDEIFTDNSAKECLQCASVFGLFLRLLQLTHKMSFTEKLICSSD